MSYSLDYIYINPENPNTKLDRLIKETQNVSPKDTEQMRKEIDKMNPRELSDLANNVSEGIQNDKKILDDAGGDAIKYELYKRDTSNYNKLVLNNFVPAIRNGLRA
ncbi:MAG: hypothetical protein LBU27_00310 [Candidatus Peribacteria bacterium]|jgi:hypothetical protein|nr:hypothetical protein [Candidatus Peribacteria bacterium]